MTILLGIESTAHTFGVGIVKNQKILANIKDSYTTKKGGIIPIEAAKHHNKVKKDVYIKSLKEAKKEASITKVIPLLYTSPSQLNLS